MEPLARWNPARSVWETTTSHLCGHSVVFSETWPNSGTTRGGQAYALPTPAHPTPGSASSSSPGLFKTPTSQLAINGGSQHPDKRKAGGHGPTLADEVEHLLPTPTVQDSANLGGPSQHERNSLPLNTLVTLLPTPQAHDAQKGKTAEQVARMRARGHGVANLNELMENDFSGAPTPQPSSGGSPSPDDLPPPPLNLAAPDSPDSPLPSSSGSWDCPMGTSPLFPD